MLDKISMTGKPVLLSSGMSSFEELDRMFQQAKNSGADVMITTEKDAVRIPETYQPVLPLYFIRMEIEIVEGFEDFEEAVEDLCKLDNGTT